MNFRGVFVRATQLLNRENIFLNQIKKNSNFQINRNIFTQKFNKIQLKPIKFYLNHQKYIAICVKNSNSTENLTKVNQTDQQNQTQNNTEHTNQQQKPKPKSRFLRLFEREHIWKLSLGVIVMMMASLSGYLLVVWGAPQVDQNGNIITDDYSSLPLVIQYPKRAINSAILYYQMFKEPTSDKLLPDPLQEPYYQPPYTLVIELTDVLVHPEWTYSTGWRYKKRPGLDYFIEQIKYPMFEVVFFTREPYTSLAPVVAAMDPNNQIQFKLFREGTKFMNGNYIKDLSCLNRDLRKIILIDADEKAYQLQPRNALHRLRPWNGDDYDTDLVYLASFLKTVAASNVDDVRDVLDYYNKEINPLDTFKLNQVKLHEAEAQRQRELEEWKKKQTSSPFSWSKKFH